MQSPNCKSNKVLEMKLSLSGLAFVGVALVSVNGAVGALFGEEGAGVQASFTFPPKAGSVAEVLDFGEWKRAFGKVYEPQEEERTRRSVRRAPRVHSS